MEEQQQQHEQQHEHQIEDQQISFHKIEELESFGINKTDIIKLKSGGYHTIEAVIISIFVTFTVINFFRSLTPLSENSLKLKGSVNKKHKN